VKPKAVDILSEMLEQLGCEGPYRLPDGAHIECIEAVERGMKPRKYPFVEGDTTHVLFPPETDEEYKRRWLCPRCKVKTLLDELTVDTQQPE